MENPQQQVEMNDLRGSNWEIGNLFHTPTVVAQGKRDEGDAPENEGVATGELEDQDFPLLMFNDYVHRVNFEVKGSRMANSFWGYLIFLMILLLVVVLNGGATAAFELNSLAQGYARVKGSFNENSPGYEDMQSVAEFWDWLQYDMLPNYYRHDWYQMTGSTPVELTADDTLGTYQMARQNLIVGALRILQKRVPTDGCSINTDSYREGAHCYSYFGSGGTADEDKTQYGAGYSYTETTETVPWVSHIPGRYTDYEEGGFVVDFAPNQTAADWTAKLNGLKDNLWIDYNTRMVQVVVNTYNPGMERWMSTNLNFEFSASGVLYRDILVRSFTPEFPLGALLLLAILGWGSIHYMTGAIFYTLREAKMTAEFLEWNEKCKHPDTVVSGGTKCKFYAKGLMRCWSVWRSIDLAQAVCMLYWLWYTSKFIAEVYDFNPDMVQLSFLNVLKLVAPVHTSTMLQGPMFFLVVMKSIRYMQMSNSLSIITNTIQIGGPDMGYFAITFACLYVAFMFWSHVTFTGLVPELSTPVTAINTNVEYFMGIIDVNALYTSDRWIGPVFAVTYIFVMTLTLVNVYIAIVSVAYAEAMAEHEKPNPFRDQETSISSSAFFRAAFTLLAYLEKIMLVFTLNLCCTTCKGLPVSAEEWQEMPVTEKLKIVLNQTCIWLFKLLLLFQFTPLTADAPSDRAKLYKHHMVIHAALQLWTKNKSLNKLGITYQAVESLIGDMEPFLASYKVWNGPPDERLGEGSEDALVKNYFEELTHAVKCIKMARVTEDPARPKAAYTRGSTVDRSRYRLLQQQRLQDLTAERAPYHDVMTIDDFPDNIKSQNVIFSVDYFSRDVPTPDFLERYCGDK